MTITIIVNANVDLSPAAKIALQAFVAQITTSLDHIGEAIIDQQDALKAFADLKATLDSVNPAPKS